eukprot:15408021-Alexandrium_andersonii.AAC.1
MCIRDSVWSNTHDERGAVVAHCALGRSPTTNGHGAGTSSGPSRTATAASAHTVSTVVLPGSGPQAQAAPRLEQWPCKFPSCATLQTRQGGCV